MPSISLPTLSAVAGIAGAGVSAVGSVMGGLATSSAASYNAQVAQNNATIANQNAAYATAAGAAKTEQVGLQQAAQGGQIKAGLAANGVDVNSGSALNVETSQRELGELDEQTTANNAELQAYGYQTQAAGFQSQSALDTMEAETAPIGADIGAAGGLLGSASSIGLKWSQPTSVASSAVSMGPTGFAVGGV